MTVTEDISQDLEPEAASAPFVSGAPATAPPDPRGHHPAIQAAVTALRTERKFPPHLRPGQRNRLILNWLSANGYGGDLPTRWAIRRYFEWEMQSAPNAQ